MSPGYPEVPELDRVFALDEPAIEDYLSAASAYVMDGRRLPNKGNATSESSKAAQSALSGVLGDVIALEVANRHAEMLVEELGGTSELHVLDPEAGETKVAGGLRTVQSDVTETHKLDGVRFAVELKPVYRAVSRAIWNRYGDVRAFAVNIHLKFPFAVVGGVMVLPTIDVEASGAIVDVRAYAERASRRLARTRRRETEADADHLLEGVGLVVFDPATEALDPELPPKGTGLRWEEFVDSLVAAYDARFGAEKG